MKIEIAVNCWNYQHRLCWMLSSLCQQRGNVPEIIFNISFAKNNGDPNTEKVCDFFESKGLNIKRMILKDKNEVSCRGPIRQKQLDGSNADWILFADCDMIYHPDFFAELSKRLDSDYKDITKVITADRVSLDINFCIDYLNNNPMDYPCEVQDVANFVSDWPVKWVHGKNIGPGYFQLANIKHIKENGIKYCNRSRDNLRRYRSDRAFRVNMGGIKPITKLPPQYHLNHDRKNTDMQR